MHLNKKITSVALAACALALTACNGFFDKDNTPTPTPLTDFRQEFIPQKQWTTNVGSGSGDEFLKMNPAFTESAIYTASVNGVITSVNKANGRINWQTNTGLSTTSGPGVGDGIVVVGTRYGDVVAVDEATGARRWKTSIPGAILANPAVGQGVVVVKTLEGTIRGLSADSGQERWNYKQTEPNLILRGSSTPLVLNGSTIIGFANGNLAKLNTNSGQLNWITPIAFAEGGFAIQRMIDIDADPLVYDHRLFAATYQGKIASLDLNSGQVRWSHDISSYTGMIADEETVFISDAKSHVWAFTADGGLVSWRQNNLAARGVTGPATMGNFVVVADAQGYLHWLSKRDGHFAARAHVRGGFDTAPVVENDVLYALTNTGNLVSYTLR